MKIARTVLSSTVLGAAFVMSATTASAAGLVASATAGYQVTFGGALRTVEFAAQRDAGNNSTGQGHLFNHVTGVDIHFQIDCLSVLGNVATISGTITHADAAAAAFLGSPMWVQVIDNGEGTNSPPDLVSPLFVIPGGPEIPCTAPLATATLPIGGGNVQVH